MFIYFSLFLNIFYFTDDNPIKTANTVVCNGIFVNSLELSNICFSVMICLL